MRTKKIITSAVTALLALIASPASADWAIDNDAAATTPECNLRIYCKSELMVTLQLR